MKPTLLFFVVLLGVFQANAQNTFTEKDREIIKLQFEHINQRFNEMDKRFDLMQKQMDVRFDALQKQIDARFEQVDKRFEQVDKRLDTLAQFMLGILATFTALCGIMFGLMIWDRRTTLKPFEEKIKAIDQQVKELAENKTTLKKMLTALQQQAKKDAQLAEILKSMNLL